MNIRAQELRWRVVCEAAWPSIDGHSLTAEKTQPSVKRVLAGIELHGAKNSPSSRLPPSRSRRSRRYGNSRVPAIYKSATEYSFSPGPLAASLRNYQHCTRNAVVSTTSRSSSWVSRIGRRLSVTGHIFREAF
jgi:hypothetical protein